QLRAGDYKYDIGRYDLSHIVNIDQTPLPFEYLSGKTYAIKGDKTVWAKSLRSGWDKRQATLVLTAFGDGKNRIKPLIIFKGTENLQDRKLTIEKKESPTTLELQFGLIQRSTPIPKQAYDGLRSCYFQVYNQVA